MRDRKTFRRGTASSLITFLFVGAICIAAVMFLISLRNELSNGSVTASITLVPTPTLIPTEPPPTATHTPTPTETPIPPTSTPVNPNDTGWVPLKPGLEVREQFLINQVDQNTIEQLILIRVDPNQFKFDVGYSPGRPQTLDSWQQNSGALIALNAGYFTAEQFATGLTIVQGQPSGSSYGPFAGMVTIGGTEPSSNIDVRWLNQVPYNPAEQLWGGFQSFPILVSSVGVAAFPASADNGDRARRTVIGKDGAGNILLMAAGRGGLTLSELSDWLAGSDFDLQIAINLDGGPSTGMMLEHPDQTIRILPFTPLPTVLLVFE